MFKTCPGAAGSSQKSHYVGATFRFQHAVEQFVGEARAGHRDGGVPAGGEQAVAIAQAIGRLAAEIHVTAGVGHDAAARERFEEGGAGGGGPAVAAIVAGFALDRVEGR